MAVVAGGSRYCQEVALETVWRSFAISSILFELASLLSALAFRMRWERSVHVYLSPQEGKGVVWTGLVDGTMKECSLRNRYLLGVVLIDLQAGSICCFGS